MTIFDNIIELYPTAIANKDFRLENKSDGSPVFLSVWNAEKLGAPPDFVKFIDVAKINAEREALSKIEALAKITAEFNLRE